MTCMNTIVGSQTIKEETTNDQNHQSQDSEGGNVDMVGVQGGRGPLYEGGGVDELMEVEQIMAEGPSQVWGEDSQLMWDHQKRLREELRLCWAAKQLKEIQQKDAAGR
ncbi:hypothetical protein EDC04DRAFT_2599416 [Pisolithus marmoratus]|nr:hypothetical protein EDC04DRAFT_2599416 [Pisolithus marmoratus]